MGSNVEKIKLVVVKPVDMIINYKTYETTLHWRKV